MKKVTYSHLAKAYGSTALAIILSAILLTTPALIQSAQAATTTTNTLTVRAYSTTGGNTLSMYTEIMSGSTIVESGFTPLTYTGTADRTYTVRVHNYEDRIFSHWGGGGSGSSNPRTLTLWGDTTAVAYYDTGSTSTASSSTTSSSTGSEKLISKTGVFVALYMYPGSTGSAHWQKVIDEKKEHPSVPIVAAFNPSSGPGSSKNSNIAYWVAKLQDAGVTAIGYVADDYGTKSLSSLRSDTDKYVNWYGADGLFIDEFTNKAGYEGHYRDLTAYAKSRGMDLTMGNPGTDVPTSYIGTVDVINTSEGKGYISITDPNLIGSSWVSGGYSGWHKDYSKDNFSVIRYDLTWLDTTFVRGASDRTGLIYITDGNDGNSRWFHVPSYFGDLVSTLDR